MDQIYKDTIPLMSAFLKNWPVKVLGGRCLSVWGAFPSYDPIPHPPTHCKRVDKYTYSYREGGGEGQLTREKVRAATLHKTSHQHDWLYLQSINFIKHPPVKTHLGFGVFIVNWSMLWAIYCLLAILKNQLFFFSFLRLRNHILTWSYTANNT